MKKSLHNAVSNIAQSFYDGYVEINARAKAKAGVKTIVVRRQLGHCCDWCAKLSGIYDFNNVPKDIYRRHDNCRCMVTVRTEKGTYKDVWSKEEYKSQRSARTARIKEIEIESRSNDLNALINADPHITRVDAINTIAKTTDVRGEYLKHSATHKGTSANLRLKSREEDEKDINCGKWLADTLGLTNDVLDTNNKGKYQKNPDFYIVDFKSRWDLKGVSSLNSIDKQLREGSKQISGEHCGLILDIGEFKQDISLEERLMAIRYRMVKRCRTNQIDVIIKSGDELIAVYRYIKR